MSSKDWIGKATANKKEASIKKAPEDAHHSQDRRTKLVEALTKVRRNNG